MDGITHCAKCGKRMVPVVTFSGRTDLQCINCDDPGVKWADESPQLAPEKPIEGIARDSANNQDSPATQDSGARSSSS